MKAKLAFGICFLAVIFLAGCKTANVNLTEEKKLDVIMDVVKILYLGPIDPIEVGEEWVHVTSMSMAGAPVFFYRNPNENADIIYASLIFYYNNLFGYTYLLKGKVYLYMYDEETERYEKSDDNSVNQSNWLYTYGTAFGLTIN